MADPERDEAIEKLTDRAVALDIWPLDYSLTDLPLDQIEKEIDALIKKSKGKSA